MLLARDAPRTVAELVDLLGITRYAVREQLAALEQDGLVFVIGAGPDDATLPGQEKGATNQWQ